MVQGVLTWNGEKYRRHAGEHYEDNLCERELRRRERSDVLRDRVRQQMDSQLSLVKSGRIGVQGARSHASWTLLRNNDPLYLYVLMNTRVWGVIFPQTLRLVWTTSASREFLLLQYGAL